MRGYEKVFVETMLPWLEVAAAIGCLLIAIFAIRSWFRDSEESAAETGRLLLDCREMLARGEITEDEYRKIKSRMSRRPGDRVSPSPAVATPVPTSTSTGDSNSSTDPDSGGTEASP